MLINSEALRTRAVVWETGLTSFIDLRVDLEAICLLVLMLFVLTAKLQYLNKR